MPAPAPRPGDKDGVRIGDLNEKAKPLAVKLFRQRFTSSPPSGSRWWTRSSRRMAAWKTWLIAFWGDASKSQHDGGNYHWKIGNATVLADWQIAGKEHIHMTVRAEQK